jgi:hypothetical protein
MRPTANQVHVDQLLTNLSIAYRNNSYIADAIYPIVPVNKQSNIIPNYDQSHWFRNDATRRLAGTKSQRGGWTVNNSQTYYAQRYSFGHEIDDETRDNADEPYNMDRDATYFVTDKLLLTRELAFASSHFQTGMWAQDKVGGVDFTQWSDYSASTPLVDITAYKDSIEGRIAVEANRIVMGKQVWVPLKWHPDLVDTIKYTQRGQLSVDLVASLMEVERIHVGRAIQTLDPDGTPESSVSYSRIWGKHLLLIYVPATPGLMTPAAGYTFVWQRVPSALQYIKRMRDEEREVDIIEANSYFAQVQTGRNAGLFMQNVVA